MPSALWCDLCRTPIDFCRCPDRDASLRQLAYDPTANVLFKWCRACDKHYARCRCAVPEFYVLSGGKEVDPTTLRDITGRKPAIDLSPDSEKPDPRDVN